MLTLEHIKAGMKVSSAPISHLYLCAESSLLTLHVGYSLPGGVFSNIKLGAPFKADFVAPSNELDPEENHRGKLT